MAPRREAASFGKFGKRLPPFRVSDFDGIHEMDKSLLFCIRQFSLFLQSEQGVALPPRFGSNRGVDDLEQDRVHFRKHIAPQMLANTVEQERGDILTLRSRHLLQSSFQVRG